MLTCYRCIVLLISTEADHSGGGGEGGGGGVWAGIEPELKTPSSSSVAAGNVIVNVYSRYFLSAVEGEADGSSQSH